MKTIERLEQMWEQDTRYTTRYMLVVSGSILTHLIFTALFGISGYRLYALMNLASVFFYIGWVTVFARKPVTDGMLLALYADVQLHACVYNLQFGWAPGFFLYPLLMIPVTFFLAPRDLKNHRAMHNSAILSGISMLLMLVTLAPGRLAQTEECSRFFHVNILVVGLLLCAYSAEFVSESLNAQGTLAHHAETDQLTGLCNRYGFLKETVRFHGTQYCIVMSDIDNFKQVNDLYGHAVGDTLLVKIGSALQSCVRKEDIVCRWGGEEFLILVKADLETACAAVERIRRKLLTVAAEANDTTVAVSMTFGIADCLEAESFEELVKIADRNLLRGKRSGKNCVMLSSAVQELGSAGQVTETEELDVSNLTGHVFSAFSATSDTTYIFICNLKTNVSRWSRTAVDYFGLPGEYMFDAGNIWLGFVHPDDRRAYAEDVDAVLSGRKHFHDVIYRARNKEGEYVRLICKGVVTEGDADHPAMFAGTITNLGPVDSLGRR